MPLNRAGEVRVADDGSLHIRVTPGRPLPLGCSADGQGFNLAVFSRHADSLDIVLFDPARGGETPAFTVRLDKPCHRTGDIWHAHLDGVPDRFTYGIRARGPLVPAEGHRFDPNKLLLDPYATALVGTECWDFAHICRVDSADSGVKPKCLIRTAEPFDWHDDCSLARPWSETVIYEAHVRGLTMHPSAGATHPGTFLGLAEKASYLQRLGITAVELLPVQEFFENELTTRDPIADSALVNYWGYSTVAFFAPKESYSTRASPGCQIDEFKTMVRTLHRAGIEVILDVVFNHTAEGDHTGPTLNYRGLDNSVYYQLEPDRRFYSNYSGCGNTLNCNHPVVRDHVLDCLRYWVIEMHVDGFRFDLASVLGRGESGELLTNPPLLERIAEDPVLRNVKLIAEAWDAGGAYQVGSFPGQRWSEWNGRFRDDVRRYWRGDHGTTGAFASRLCGSADIYQRGGKAPLNSINFVTCHDGFTLHDLVTYRAKHNDANGLGGSDGSNDNFSDNYGIEGETDEAAIVATRLRQSKNLLASLLLARGVPMLLGGDEFLRTQRGNNNAYCQDNELSWYDWRLLDTHREMFEFAQRLIAFRRRHPVLSRESFYRDDELAWFGTSGEVPVWDGPAQPFGCGITTRDGAGWLCLLFNPTPNDASLALPAELCDRRWVVEIDTAGGESGHEPTEPPARVALPARSLRVLVGQ